MVNSIAIERKNYDNDNEFWSAVSMFLRLLTENDYITTFKYEDCGVYVIEFNYKDQSMGAEYPYWLTPEQYEQINFDEDDITASTEDEPAADVWNVVRCKDCKYYQNATVNEGGFLVCPASGMEITDYDYCSYGERKDEEE